SYNYGTPINPIQNTFYVQFREKREQLRDFDQFINIKQDERARVNYQKKKNQSVVTYKLKGEKRIREVFPGFKYLELITDQGNLDINIK
ncbi:MAG: hypothetical protein M1275_02690, partial [Patescibacteria group bacterium]|nr:hypothetical protein [Patescibacteria group bacterium]